MLYNDIRIKQRRRDLRNFATEAEQRLWFALRKSSLAGFKFRRQYGVGRYIIDFYCPARRLAVEVDGGQHYEPENLKYDEERTAYLHIHDIRVVRVTNAEVIGELEAVLEKILEVATAPITRPPHSLRSSPLLP